MFVQIYSQIGSAVLAIMTSTLFIAASVAPGVIV
jgi:hypothetical protein